MAKVVRAWVDSPLITSEIRVPREGIIYPWQSPVKGVRLVYEPFSAYGTLDTGETIRCYIPKDFITDFYSIPGFARPLIPKSQVGWNQAAVVHDKLYMDNTVDLYEPTFGTWSSHNYVSRYLADQMLLALMEQFEAPPMRKHIIYNSVRIGGLPPWNACREKQKGGEPFDYV